MYKNDSNRSDQNLNRNILQNETTCDLDRKAAKISYK